LGGTLLGRGERGVIQSAITLKYFKENGKVSTTEGTKSAPLYSYQMLLILYQLSSCSNRLSTSRRGNISRLSSTGHRGIKIGITWAYYRCS